MVPSPFAMSPWLELPYEIRNVSPEEDKAIKKCLIGYTKTFVKCGKMGYVMPGAFRKHAEAIYNMRVRPDDIWVITFPRSGTTWTQEMVWLIENDLDYKSAKKQPLFERFPMLETTSQIPEIAFELIKANFMNLGYFQGLNNAVKVPSWKSIDEAPSPRFIKTHLPISLLPPSLLSTAKVIYVARDPRDVAVSYYYLHKMVSKTLMRSTFTHFWDAFRRDLRTTWTQEMVWLIENDLDYKSAKKQPLFERFPMLETTSQIPEIAFELIKANFMNLGYFQGLNNAVKVPSWKSIDEAPSPRFIKTHLPISLLPPSLLSTAKVIYVARDPRDVAVSYYYLHKMVSKTLMRSTFTHFWDAFRRDLLPWTPIIEHTNEAWDLRHAENMHFLFYEDMIKDLPKVIRGVCKFLDRKYSDEQVTKLSEHLSFNNLQKNKTVNNTANENGEIQFIRKGEAGGWRTHFDAKMEFEAEEFLSTKLKGLTLKYPSLCDADGEPEEQSRTNL